MKPSPLNYALVTPARNEVVNLPRLAASLLSQTVQPSAWIVVDDGSSDDTLTVAQDLARTIPWLSATCSPGAADRAAALRHGRRVGRDVIAFHAGLRMLDELPDVAFKLDADVSMAPDYFERLLDKFAADPALGIASGICYELEGGRWIPFRVTAGHVRGATRGYRRECLTEILPLEERIGWDAIDELRANLRNWRTQSFSDLPFYHHRSLGSRDGLRAAWRLQGELAYYLQYRVSYVILRALFRASKQPAAIMMIAGYLVSWIRREERYPDRDVRELVRRQQSLRQLPRRMREVLGRA